MRSLAAETSNGPESSSTTTKAPKPSADPRYVGVEAMGYFVVKAGASMGQMVSKSMGWDANITHTFGGTYDNTKLSLRGIGHIGKSLYLLAGLGGQLEKYTSNMSGISKSDRAESSWNATTVGVEAGIGNRWWNGHIYTGWQWLEIYKPIRLVGFKEKIGDTKLRMSPMEPSIKLCMFQIGTVW